LLGFLNHVVAAEELEGFTRTLASRIAGNSALAISVIKEQMRILSGAQTLTPETFEKIQALRRIVFETGDYREGIQRSLRKRKTVPAGT
jgi:methylmalonyl-CoA decarboxylase